MHPNQVLIERFYRAFQEGNYRVMQECYHPQVTFNDPVFVELSSAEARAMWHMLITSAVDLRISYHDAVADDSKGAVRWEGRYTFSRTGMKVHNIIKARMEFRDGRIFRHEDYFDFWRWSRQALGIRGVLLGWTPLVRNKVRATARKALDKFMMERQTA